MTEEQDPRARTVEPDHPDDTARGAPPGRDPDFQLNDEVGEEAKRLATQPRDEAHRLGRKLTAGQSEATPFIALSVVGIWVGLIVAIVLVVVVVAIYLTS